MTATSDRDIPVEDPVSDPDTDLTTDVESGTDPPTDPLAAGAKVDGDHPSRVARMSGPLRRHKGISIGVGAVVVAGLVVLIIVLAGSNNSTKVTQPPLSQNPIVVSYQKQLPALAEAVKATPTDAKALRNYGVALYATGDVSRAKDQYEAELKVNQSDPVLLNNLGNVYRDLGTYDKAIASYQKSISLDPKSANSYINLANLYQYTMNQQDLGIKTLQQALVSLPDNPDLGVLLGIAYEHAKDTPNALAAFNLVLKQSPTNAAALAGVKRLGG